MSDQKITCAHCGHESPFGVSACTQCGTEFRYTPAYGQSEGKFLHSWDIIGLCAAGLWVIFVIMLFVSIANFMAGEPLVVVFGAPISIFVFLMMLSYFRNMIADNFVKNGLVESEPTGKEDH